MPRNCSGGGSRAETTVVFPTTARPRGTGLPPPQCRDPVTTPCTGRPHAPPREAEPPLRATPPAWCGTRRGRDVNRGVAGLPSRTSWPRDPHRPLTPSRPGNSLSHAPRLLFPTGNRSLLAHRPGFASYAPSRWLRGGLGFIWGVKEAPGGPWAWLSLRPGEQRAWLSRYRRNYQHPSNCERELVPEPLGSAVRQNHWMAFKCPGLHARPVKFEFLEVGPRHRYFYESSPLRFWCAR